MSRPGKMKREDIVDSQENGIQLKSAAAYKENGSSDHDKSQPMEEYDIDGMFKFIGDIGKYQIGLNLLMSLFVLAPTFQNVILVFAGSNPTWRCSSVGNLTGTCNISGVVSEGMSTYNDRCRMKRIHWEYAVPKEYSIVSQFELVCDRSTLTHLTTSSYFLGGIFGAPIIGWSSDRFGRLRTQLFTYAIVIVVAALSVFSPNIWVYILCRFIIGGCFTGMMALVTLSTEIVGPAYRALFSVLPWYAWTLALCLMSLQAYYIRSWTTLTLITSVPYACFLIPFRYYPDSIRWLRVRKGADASMRVIKEIARWNKRTIPPNVKLLPIAVEDQVNPSLKDVLWPQAMLRRTVLQSLVRLENGLVYFGITMATSSLSGNLYRDFFYLGIVEAFSYALTPIFANRVGRRLGTLTTMIATGLLLALIGLLPLTKAAGVETGRIILGILAKFTTTTAYNLIVLWSFELYPTSIRCTAMSVGEIANLSGSVMAPWVALWLGTFYADLPFFAMAGIAVVTSLVCLLLPETNGILTTDVVEESSQAKEVGNYS